MPTPAERQALLFFAAIAALGVGTNAWKAARGETPLVAGSQADLATQIARVDSAVARSPSREARALQRGQGTTKRRTYTLGLPTPPTPPSNPRTSNVKRPTSIIDLDTASADALEALPRIGPALARRIVADRDSFGAFGTLDGLQRVRGIGPAMARTLHDLVTFSGVPRPGAPTGAAKGRRRPAVP